MSYDELSPEAREIAVDWLDEHGVEFREYLETEWTDDQLITRMEEGGFIYDRETGKFCDGERSLDE